MVERSGFVVVEIETGRIASDNNHAAMFWAERADAVSYRDGLAGMFETIQSITGLDPQELRVCPATLSVDAAEEVT